MNITTTKYTKKRWSRRRIFAHCSLASAIVSFSRPLKAQNNILHSENAKTKSTNRFTRRKGSYAPPTSYIYTLSNEEASPTKLSSSSTWVRPSGLEYQRHRKGRVMPSLPLIQSKPSAVAFPKTFPSAKTNDAECARNISKEDVLSSCWWHSSSTHQTNLRCTTPRDKPIRSTTLIDRVDCNDFPRDTSIYTPSTCARDRHRTKSRSTTTELVLTANYEPTTHHLKQIAEINVSRATKAQVILGSLI